MSQHAIELGDVIEVLRGYQDNSFDAVLCDPPYGLSFMGKKWDYDVPQSALWAEVLRVCKPGAALIAFSGTRTYHRTVVQIEDAGWEIRDQLAWMYGSGFPKSMNVSIALDKAAGAEREVIGEKRTPDGKLYSARVPNSNGAYNEECAHSALSGQTKHNTQLTAPATEAAQQWAGFGTALKPAFEPAVLARKPLEGTMVANVTRWGVGALAIDPCRVGYASDADKAKMSDGVEKIRAKGGVMEGSWKNSSDLSGANPASDLGRWPANVILDEEAGAALDAQSGNRPGMSGGGKHKAGATPGMFGAIDGNESHARGDSGGASRFFIRRRPAERSATQVART